MKLLASFLAVAIGAAACSGSKAQPPAYTAPDNQQPPAQRVPIGQLPQIDINAVLGHTKVLSSDDYEGRAPARVAKRCR